MFPISIEANDIINKKSFIANEIVPIAIKKFQEDDKLYVVLFMAKEYATETFRYLQFVFGLNDPKETEFIESCPIYIDNINKSKAQANMYAEMVQSMREHNTSVLEPKFSKDEKRPNHHMMKSFREIDKSNHVEQIDIYIRDKEYIMLRLFLQQFSNCDPYSLGLFASPEFNRLDIEFVNIENVRYKGSKEVEIGIPKTNIRQKVCLSFYSLHTGFNEFRVSQASPTLKDRMMSKIVSDALIQEYLKPGPGIYQNIDLKIPNDEENDDGMILILPGGINQRDKKPKLYCLRLRRKVLDLTNFEKYDNIIYYGKNKDDDNTVIKNGEKVTKSGIILPN